MKLGLTLGLYMGWLWALYLNGQLLHTYTAILTVPAGPFFFAFLICHSLSLLIISRLSNRICIAKPGFILSAGLITAISSILPAFPIPFSSLPLLVITLSVAAAGIGAAILLASCGVAFSQLSIKSASISFVIAVLIGTVFFYGINLTPHFVTVLSVALIPIIIAWQLSQNPALSSRVPDTGQHSAPRLPVRLIIVLAITYSTGGLMHKITDFYSPSPILESYWLTAVIYCFTCIASGIVIYKFPDIDLRLIYRPVVPLLASGFILFPPLAAMSSYGVIVPFVFLQAGFALLDIYTWLLFVYLGGRYNNPQAIVAEGMFFITFFMFIGESMFADISPISMVVDIHLPMVSYSAAIILSLATLVFRDERESFSNWEQQTTPIIHTPEIAPLDLRLASNETLINHFDQQNQLRSLTDNKESNEEFILGFMTTFRLTEREEEIVLLLVKGRNNPFILEYLSISPNTLKTHLRNIYRKCGVTNRQELISLIERS